MPYSMSHAVVAIPVSHLTKGKVPTAAVIVGSISPDFPYLLVLTPTHAPGHSILGVLVHCLFPALAALFIWYRWLEKPTLAFWKLPERSRSAETPSIPLIIVGVLIGALSHVLWDSTSHSYSAIVESSPFWNFKLLSLPIYKWNQYLSGVFGLVILGLWYLNALMKNIKTPYAGNFYGGVVIYAISIMAIVLIGNILHQSNSIGDIAVRTSIGVMSGGVVAAVVYGAMNQARHNA